MRSEADASEMDGQLTTSRLQSLPAGDPAGHARLEAVAVQSGSRPLAVGVEGDVGVGEAGLPPPFPQPATVTLASKHTIKASEGVDFI